MVALTSLFSFSHLATLNKSSKNFIDLYALQKSVVNKTEPDPWAEAIKFFAASSIYNTSILIIQKYSN